MDDAARAVFSYHQVYGITHGRDGIVSSRRYLDCSSRNFLVTESQHETEIVLMDPPEFEKNGPVHLDLGVFCFDLSRAGFLPVSLIRHPQTWLHHLKEKFLKAYFSYLGHTFSSQDISEVREGEKLRARQVLGFYARFMQFPNWPYEFLRFGYFTPFIFLYQNLQLDLKFRNTS